MAYLAPSTRRCGRGTGATIVTTMAVDFKGIVVAPLPAIVGEASLTPLRPPIARFVPAPPLHGCFLPTELKLGPGSRWPHCGAVCTPLKNCTSVNML